MKESANIKIVLGTAQFGLDYGISNTSGKVSKLIALEILDEATKVGIDTLDTAIIYGDSENILGEAGVENFNIVTKLPPLPKNILNLNAWVLESIESSLNKLNVDRIYGLLLHQSGDLLGNYGSKLYSILCNLKKDRLVGKIGVSIYNPSELDSLKDNGFELDIVQAPFNILDRRLETSGWLRKLKLSGVEIHIRSVFLQGLLLLDKNNRNQYFSKWADHFIEYDKWIKQTNQTPLSACLNFVNSYRDIDKMVVGVETAGQLREIVLSIDNNYKIPLPDNLKINDAMLINPSNWRC
jgi:aryl-alcohol dehydrogenase-like predicted oxidoreductase